MTIARTSSLAVVAFITVAALAPAVVHADGVHGDIELDPTAYALAGNSIHVGISASHLRIDLGNFAMALPQFIHGDDGFDVSFSGFGAKLQYFPRLDQHGMFFGVDADVVKVRAELQGSDRVARDVQVGVGVHLGYRIALPKGFYVTPWIGVGYQASADDLTVGAATYAPSAITVFPAIHVGYRFP
ncbi:MAG: hypothetical protein NT062_29245 [Proteobacteria bacterium]|nr:hypothetical protein [Pseudomonadota bacterium]